MTGGVATHFHSTSTTAATPLSFLWLEITGTCNLKCVHCYAESGPSSSHGSMQTEDWKRTIDEAADLGTDVVQFIGGEPTLHPAFCELVEHAARRGLGIEVYTNLTHVTDDLWSLFQTFDVSLAVSFYSTDPTVHDEVTTRPGSQARTWANIARARELGIPTRVGIIEVVDGQDAEGTAASLRSLGVADVGIDRMRKIGRAGDTPLAESVDELCGACGGSNAAVDPNGWVYPCVFSRWLKVGNVRAAPLRDVVGGDRMRRTKADLNQRFDELRGAPDACGPWTQCNPQLPPCSPTTPPPGPCAPVSCVPCIPSGCPPVQR